MVLISQVWIQHLPCTQILGYSYLRVGSAVDPDLACPLYSALVTALSELQKDNDERDAFVHLSSVYGYSPQTQGLGLLTMQQGDFRIVLLCEGFTGKGIPYLIGDTLTKVLQLLNQLGNIITEEDCQQGHTTEDRDESFWWNLVVKHGMGQLQIEKEITKIYPLRFVKIQFKKGKNDKIVIHTLEDVKQRFSYGFGFDDLVEKKIQMILKNPHDTFELYRALFQQMAEFQPDFSPNSLVLIYHKGDFSDMTSALVVLLSLTTEELALQFGVPLVPGLYLEESRDIYAILQGIASISE